MDAGIPEFGGVKTVPHGYRYLIWVELLRLGFHPHTWHHLLFCCVEPSIAIACLTPHTEAHTRWDVPPFLIL